MNVAVTVPVAMTTKQLKEGGACFGLRLVKKGLWQDHKAAGHM